MPYGTPAQLANLRPRRPEQHRSYKRVLAEARKASPETMQTAIKCMRDPEASWPARLKACEMILDRAHGAPDKLLQTDRENGAAGTSALRIEIVDPDRHQNEIDAIDTPPPPDPVGLVLDAPKEGDNK